MKTETYKIDLADELDLICKQGRLLALELRKPGEVEENLAVKLLSLSNALRALASASLQLSWGSLKRALEFWRPRNRK